jgi:hypothetical protein
VAEKINVAELNVEFTGDTRELQKEVQKASTRVRDSLGRFAKAGDGVTKAFDDNEKAAKRFGLGAIDLNAKIQLVERGYAQLKQTIGGAIDLAQLGAQSERIEDRFGKFATTIGNADEILAAFNRGTGDTVDQLTAMNNAALLIQQGLVGTADQMAKVTELATRLGNQTLAASDRISIFSQLLRNQSIRLLDDFGISSGKVRMRIKELQAATEDLSREEAFRIAVFEQGQIALDVLGERVDDNAAKMERAQARLMDFRVEMGEKLVPVVARGASIVSELDTSTIALIATFTGIVGVAAKFSGGMGELLTKLNLTGKQFGATVAAGAALIGTYEAIRFVQRQITEGQENINEALARWKDAAATAVEGGQSLENTVADMAARVNEANAILHENAEGGFIVADAFRDAATALARATSENKVMAGAAAEARNTILSQADSLEEANALIRLYNSEIENSKARIDELTQVQFKAIENQEKMNDAQAGFLALDPARAQDALSASIDDLVQVQEEAIEKATELEERTIAVSDAFDVAAGAADADGRSFDAVELAMGRVSEAELKLQNDLELLGRAFSLGAIAADELTERLRQAEQGTLDLSFAERKALTETADDIVLAREAHIQALKDEEEALKKARQAELDRIETQREAIKSQLEQAEALKGAGEQEIARAAIKQLEKAQQAGLITFEDFTQAVVEIQDKFGLADDRSRALTLGLGTLVQEMSTGGIAANEFDDALSLLIADAEDGIVAFDKLKEQIENVKNATNETIEVFNAATGQFEEMMVGGAQAGMVFNAATGQLEQAPAAAQGTQIIDALTGQVVTAPQQQPPAQAGVTIYGGLHLEGIQDVEGFLAQLQALTPLG